MSPEAEGTAAWSSDELEAAMGALVAVLSPSGPPLPGAARVVAAVQAHLGTAFDPDTIEAIDPFDLKERLRHPWLRQQLVRVLVVGALIDDAPTRAQLDRIRVFATALDVVEPGVRDLELYLLRRRWRLRRHLLARFWAIDRLRARIAERGFLRAVVPAIWATVFRRHRDPVLAARFATLRDLPAGTLGQGFLAYLTASGFGLPGEKGSVSDIIVAHDLAHVLAGYGTTPDEEVQVACFSAGHRRKDPFAMVLFVLFQFHLGLQMTPGAKPERGHFVPARVVAALVRGSRVNVDLTGAWDYWPNLGEDLDALRARLGVAPRDARALGHAA